MRGEGLDQPGQARRHEHHHQHEDDALVQQPRTRQVGHGIAEEGHHRRAQGGTEEDLHAADIAVEHHRRGGRGLEHHIVGCFHVERLQRARDAGEHGRDGEHQHAEAVRVIAEKTQAVGVLAQAQGQAAHRGQREQIQQGERQQHPEQGQVVHLVAVAEAQAPRRHAHGGQARLATKPALEVRRQRVQQFSQRQRDHGEVDAGALGGEPAGGKAGDEAQGAAGQRQ